MTVERGVMVAMRDGVRLATDVYLADSGGPFPALLERTPYDKRRPFLLETARFFQSRGYAVVLQDVRGRHGSEGEWYFLSEREGPDGFDTMAWIAGQPWCDGQVGTMGLSYSTATQQALAVLGPPALKTQILLEGGYDYHYRTVRHSGAFEMGVLLPHALRLAREQGELSAEAFEEVLGELPNWLRDLPLDWERSPLRRAPAEERWLRDMLTRADYDGFWRTATLNLAEHVERYPDIPVLMQTSWYGHHVWATFAKYAALRRYHRSPKRLLVGPWLHGYEEYARSFAGEADFGPASALDLNALRLRWFDQFLKGRDTGVLDGPPIRLFVMGGGSGGRNAEGRLEHGGTWREESEWPLARVEWTAFHLHPEGSLRREAPPAAASPARYRYDPTEPVPTIGGGTQNPLFPGFLQGGAFDQRARADLWACRDTRPLAERSDVLVFQTPPLTEDVEVTGPVTVRLWVSSSAAVTDFTAKLVDVHPEGFAMNLSDGIVRARYRRSRERAEPMAPGEVAEVAIELPATSNIFKAGHSIRLDVSSSNFPRFDPNPNTGGPLGSGRDSVVAENAVYCDAAHPSHVLLPLVPRPDPVRPPAVLG